MGLRQTSALLLWICLTPVHASDQRAPADRLAEVSRLLSGSYSSAQQARSDAEYVDVHLHMVPIWAERPGEHWLYVEQALASALDTPYRQRVYHLVESEGGVVSEVYTLPDDPLKYAGAWRQPERFSALTPADLKLRAGCAIQLYPQDDGSYVGSTTGQSCASDLRGAAYATSEVRLDAHTLESWDRGYAADGKQAWGAVKGAYRFQRLPQ